MFGLEGSVHSDNICIAVDLSSYHLAIVARRLDKVLLLWIWADSDIVIVHHHLRPSRRHPPHPSSALSRPPAQPTAGTRRLQHCCGRRGWWKGGLPTGISRVRASPCGYRVRILPLSSLGHRPCGEVGSEGNWDLEVARQPWLLSCAQSPLFHHSRPRAIVRVLGLLSWASAAVREAPALLAIVRPPFLLPSPASQRAGGVLGSLLSRLLWLRAGGEQWPSSALSAPQVWPRLLPRPCSPKGGLRPLRIWLICRHRMPPILDWQSNTPGPPANVIPWRPLRE